MVVKFENEYSTTGNGLHSFEDTDGHQYVYSQLEPYHASKMFPCFDQPDLKGVFKLMASAPQEWTVISNERRVPFKHEHHGSYLSKYGLFNVEGHVNNSFHGIATVGVRCHQTAVDIPVCHS